jgi:HK97 family phage major capsid protein
MKTLLQLLVIKGILMADYDAMDFEAKSDILNELNEENTKALETIQENQEAAKKLNDELHKAVKTQGQAITGMLKGNSGASTEKSDFIKFVETNTVEFGEMVENKQPRFNGLRSVAIKAPALMTTANVVPNVVGGFTHLFGNYIDPMIHATPKPDNFILPLVNVITAPGTENIWYVERENEEGDAAFIGEGDLKPLADGEWVEKKADIKEVAVRWKMSNRLIMHAPSVVQNFRTHVTELIDQKIDDGVASGDGIGNNLSGISTLAAPFVVPTALANYYTATNIYDVVNATASYVRLNNFKGALTCVLNTVWQAKMLGIKDAENNYISPAFVTPDGRTIGEVNVIFSNKVDEADILLGDLMKFNAVISENVNYFEGWENDDFSKNLSSRKLEAYLGTYLPDSDAGAIIFDQIATIETAITV